MAVASAGPYASLHLTQTDNHASTPPLSFLQARYPSCCPTNSVKALKANTVKVVVSQKWCKIDTLLLHTTNRKYHRAYWFMLFPKWPWMTIVVIFLLQGFSNAIRRTFVQRFAGFWLTACPAVPRQQLNFLYLECLHQYGDMNFVQTFFGPPCINEVCC